MAVFLAQTDGWTVGVITAGVAGHCFPRDEGQFIRNV
jgi:hypothetical protein